MTPQRTAFSRAEALAAARVWMVKTYGRPKDLPLEAAERWHGRYGLLVDFLSDLFLEETAPDAERG